jgi:hypothetical protein
MHVFLLAGVWVMIIAGLIWKGRRFGWSLQSMMPDEHDGLRFRYGEDKNKFDRVLKTRVAFKVPEHLRFELRKEGRYDRLAKALRLVTELQIGHSSIDDRFFFEDEGTLVEVLGKNENARSGLAMLFTRLRLKGAHVQWISCRDGDLVVQIYTGFHSDPRAVRSDTVGWMRPLIEALRAHEAPVRVRRRHRDDRALLPRLVLLAAFLTAGLGIVLANVLQPDRLLDPWALVLPAMATGSVVFALFLVWALIQSGTTPRRHRLLIEWVLVGWPAMIVCAGFALRFANFAFDHETPVHVAVTGAALYTKYHRKGGTSYWMGYRTEHPQLRPYGSLRLDAATYDRLRMAWHGDSIERTALLLHPGALGHAWVDVLP